MGLRDTLNTYRGKKVLVTGHTGFKGSWLSIWLHTLGAKVVGMALDPRTGKDNFALAGVSELLEADYREDIRDLGRVQAIFEQEQPEVVFHLAAQPLVLDSYRDPVYTYETNVMGTVNLLEACRNCPAVQAMVFITTDKCYDNKEWVYPYRENDSMGGYDPYSSSKGAAELLIDSYRNSFLRPRQKRVASVRAGNVIGGGDWSPNRIVVDLVEAIESGTSLEVRSPQAVRPWQHVLEPLSGYLLLAGKMMQSEQGYDEAWNFGPYLQSILPVSDLVERFLKQFGRGDWRDVSDPSRPHEAKLLMLDISKAIYRLGWRPVLTFEETVELTVDWYLEYKHRAVLDICQEQIERYLQLWESRNEKLQEMYS